MSYSKPYSVLLALHADVVVFYSSRFNFSYFMSVSIILMLVNSFGSSWAFISFDH
uniref:Uncharacterized protein n=1 Tax=Solanum lycopersicum TaxID=4081 RepID=A0A3Q7EER6_SOLLC